MPPSLEPATEASPAETARGYRSTALALLTLGLIALCVILLLPFLPALAWGVALAVIAWPLQSWMIRHVHRRTLAAGLTTAVIIILIVVPGLFVVYQLSREAATTADQMRGEKPETAVRDRLAGTPGGRDPSVVGASRRQRGSRGSPGDRTVHAISPPWSRGR